jgi:hypothetical protein
MFWDHADTGTYLRWLTAAGLRPIWDRYIPEGDSGHTLVLAQRRIFRAIGAYMAPSNAPPTGK